MIKKDALYVNGTARACRVECEPVVAEADRFDGAHVLDVRLSCAPLTVHTQYQNLVTT